ncbi:MAG: pilus assembly FimT family protein [Planctomycetota bacterium]|jgi:prepilin-type N-terminal cleavage/methylation domain-containing protein
MHADKSYKLMRNFTAPPRRRGFTLVELTLVVMLIAVAFGVTIVKLDNLAPPFRLRKASRMIAAQIRMLQNECILDNRRLFLIYDISERKYWIEIPTDDSDFAYSFGEGEKVGEDTLPPGIEFESVLGPENDRIFGQAKVELSPTGELGSHIVHLKIRDSDRDEDRLSVKYNSFSGLTSISEGFTEFERPPDAPSGLEMSSE